jgi:hypothetical protein
LSLFFELSLTLHDQEKKNIKMFDLSGNHSFSIVVEEYFVTITYYGTSSMLDISFLTERIHLHRKYTCTMHIGLYSAACCHAEMHFNKRELEESVFPIQDVLVLLAEDYEGDGPLERHEAPDSRQ